MCARGMAVREIQWHLMELYGLEVFPGLISTITNEVVADNIVLIPIARIDSAYTVKRLKQL